MEAKSPQIGQEIIEKAKKIIAETPKIHFYTLTSEVWDAIYTDCVNAKKSIYIEMFIMAGDTSETHDFMELFKRKAGEGLKIVLLLDALGSLPLEYEDIRSLRESGIEVKFFAKWLSFTHRKLIIIDEHKVYVGGVNIKKSFKDWVDLMVSIELTNASIFLKSFASSYALSGGKDPQILAYKKRLVEKNFNFGLIDHIPFLGYFRLKNYLYRKLLRAKKSVTIVTPYLVLPIWLEQMLKKSVERGIKVSIIIPKSSDNFFGRVASKYFLKKISAYGVHIFLLPYMNHGKAIMIDDSEAMIGSGNFDNLSIRRNSEIGVFFSEDAQVSEIKTIFNKWISEAKEYESGMQDLKWYEHLSFPLVWLLFPFI